MAKLEADKAVDTLKRLPVVLAGEGYTDAFTIYGALNARVEAWTSDRHLLPARTRTLFELFLLGRSVPASHVEEIFEDFELKALEDLAIIFRSDDQIQTGGLALVPAFGYLLIVQRPTINPAVYFGEDSAALAVHLMPPVGGDCLDLCAGSGIQAMLCARRTNRVTAVEINPLTAAYAELNVVMNNLEQAIEIKNGDLYQTVDSRQFDFICANPPLLPFPEGLPYPFVGHGGSDGLNVTRRIIDGLPKALKPEGLCQIIGTCLGDDEQPFCASDFQTWANNHGYLIGMTVPFAAPLNPGSQMFEGLAWSCALAASLNLQDIREQFGDHLKGLGATRLYFFFLAIRKNERHPGFTLTTHYKEKQGFWFV